jgi:hypothetical protein
MICESLYAIASPETKGSYWTASYQHRRWPSDIDRRLSFSASLAVREILALPDGLRNARCQRRGWDALLLK